jgi:hypothetical protein
MLAVTLELFPTHYRKCLFQLILLPLGTLVSTSLIQIRNIFRYVTIVE